MDRIRTIKPEFPQSESMGRVSRDARLCFVLLWTFADDSGRLRGNSRMLASLLFPYDSDAAGLIDGWLGELERENCLVRYTIDGNSYIEICKWLEHQKIDKPSASKFPPFANVREDSPKAREDSSLDQGPRTKDQGPRKGRGMDANSLRLPERIDSERNRKQLADWLAVRSQNHPTRPPLSEISWDAAVMKFAHLSESQWFEALRLSTEVGSLSLCDPSKPRNGPAKPPPPPLKKLTPIGELP